MEVATRCGVLLVLLGGCASASTHVMLCDEMARIGVGDSVAITITAIYDVGPERAVLYEQSGGACDQDIQPETWVRVQDGVVLPMRLRELISREGRALVTVRGTLVGPKPAKPDSQPELPTWMTIPHRLSGLRYGHNNHWRTEFIVHEFLSTSPVSDLTPSYAARRSTRPDPRLPTVSSAAVPTYPRAAQMASISGIVVLRVEYHDAQIVSIEVLSGDRTLADEAAANVRTWRLQGRQAGVFDVQFAYVLEARDSGDDRNIHVQMLFPLQVRVTAPSERW